MKKKIEELRGEELVDDVWMKINEIIRHINGIEKKQTLAERLREGFMDGCDGIGLSPLDSDELANEAKAWFRELIEEVAKTNYCCSVKISEELLNKLEEK